MASRNEDDPKTTMYMEMNEYFGTRNVAEHATHVLPYIKPDSHILDVGCGIGSIALDFARRAQHGHVIGIDNNQDSINTANAAARASGLTNITFQTGDAYDLSAFAPSSFDIVHAHQVLLHLADPVRAAREMRRVARDAGGIVAARDNISATALPTTPAITAVWDLYCALARRRGADPAAGTRNHAWVHAAGFPWERVERGVVGWGYETRAQREMLARNLRDMMREPGLKFGMAEVELFDQHRRDYDEWAAKDEARSLWMDGWVIGKK